MAAKRKVHTAAFKAQVALAAHTGDRTVNELAGHYGVHPTLIHGWKKQLVTGAAALCGSPAHAAAAARQAARGEPSGRLKIELEWFPKKRSPSWGHQRLLIEPGHPALSRRRPGALLGLSRSSLSDEPGGATAASRRRRRRIDEQSTAGPFSGRRRRTEGRSKPG